MAKWMIERGAKYDVKNTEGQTVGITKRKVRIFADQHYSI